MGWAIAGGLLGIIIMFGAYRWLIGWATARSGLSSISMIGTRPRRLAGVPEEAPADARTPPAMEVLRHGADAANHAAAAAAAVEAANAASAAAAVEAESKTTVDDPVTAVPISSRTSGMEVAEVHHGSDDAGEFVVITNTGVEAVALHMWKLTDDGEKHSYEFPDVVIAAGESINVHMWRGEDTATDLYVGRRSNWWNNSGDIAYLYDAEGELVHQLAIEVTDLRAPHSA